MTKKSNKVSVPSKNWIGSDDVLFELSRYILNHQWDLFKHSDSKAATLFGASGTILSIFLGLQLYGFKILDNIELISIKNIFSIETLSVTIFIIEVICFFLSIILSLIVMKFHLFDHLDPVGLISNFKLEDELKTKILTTKALARNWFSNQYFISKKNNYIKWSVRFLASSLLLLPISLIVSGIVLIR